MSPPHDLSKQGEVFRARDLTIPVRSRALVMGIVNLTPDSFWEGGRHDDPDAALDHALALIDQGADLLDIGAESSRPGSEPIGREEELGRLLPVVEALRKKSSIPLSIDTTKAEVARRALDAGASIVNDISALRFDPDMARVVAEVGAGVILMHMQGTPKTMQVDPRYADVVQEVRAFLLARIQFAGEAGIGTEQILLDPGFGFGKTVEQNMALLGQLRDLAGLGQPLCVGVSRKSFIGQVLDRRVDQRLMGTAAAVAAAVERGARILRVHDVAAMRDVVRMVEAVLHHASTANG